MAQTIDRPNYIAGVDLGKERDRSVLVIINTENRDIDYGGKVRSKPFVVVGFIQVWPRKTPYTKVAAEVARLTNSYSEYANMPVVLDYTGVGNAAGEIFADYEIDIYPVVITGGSGENIRYDEPSTIPKVELVHGMNAYFDSGRIDISTKLRYAKLLKKQMEKFKAKRTETGNLTYGAESGHDDVVLALSLAIFGIRITTPQVFIG